MLQQENPIQIALKVRNGKQINLMVDNNKVELLPEEVIVETVGKDNISVESDGEVTVGLLTEIDSKLLEEGL